MPYIKAIKREELDPYIDDLNFKINNHGKLNYVITRLILDFEPESYDDYLEIIGTFEMVKLEYYRKVVAFYEDKKCEEHGDVY